MWGVNDVLFAAVPVQPGASTSFQARLECDEIVRDENDHPYESQMGLELR